MARGSEKRVASFGLIGAYSLARDGRVAAVLPVQTPETQSARTHLVFLLNFADEIHRRLTGQTGTR